MTFRIDSEVETVQVSIVITFGHLFSSFISWKVVCTICFFLIYVQFSVGVFSLLLVVRYYYYYQEWVLLLSVPSGGCKREYVIVSCVISSGVYEFPD